MGWISASDFVKSSLINQFSAISVNDLVLGILFAFAAGLFIYFAYYINFRGVLFSQNFGIMLIMMTLITTPLIMCIKSSIQLSMGMVGALSIVRFRTAVKEPIDTAYIYWALATGILLGAGMYYIALLILIAVAGIMFAINRFIAKNPDTFLLVLRYQESAENDVRRVLQLIKHQRLKSKTITKTGVEMTLEVRVDKQNALLAKLNTLPGVHDATLVAFQNEVL